ncbi:hypothetical protein Pmar_PMAR027334 [Perkinsus marinus ATCC 50983]|uniref:Uncharacterized protein n=1 Tax=Perkinsus marinus (strain ATCC 50983 / TXsc) TaxID=423536 RepID=C5M1Q0_PERM5|nr:hypothetical protein Pmar_PMAR027334 [Perkinsus marinus ATCC 50983]EEQ97088.1 hypothetical protein Pmar_PMAR027334 [Perkinsus marinus ATCC 50983]|eukprot:XP_002764371.1 hypothetical protein Pmar_PMAR027334 [Perkinsus marinus ATCC 50983]
MCEMGESPEAIWATYNKKILDELHTASSSGTQPLPLHDISLSDIRVYIKEVNRARSSRPPTIGSMEIMTQLDKRLKPSEQDNINKPPASVPFASVPLVGEHPTNGPRAVTQADVVKEWVVRPRACVTAVGELTDDLGEPRFDVEAIDDDPKVANDKLIEAISQEALGAPVIPSVAREVLDAMERVDDPCCGTDNDVIGHKEDQVGRSTTNIICPHCKLPKVRGFNQHTDDGSRYGACPMKPKDASLKKELQEMASERLKDLVVVGVRSEKKQRCGYCNLLTESILQDPKESTTLPLHEKFQDDEIGGKLIWYCPVAPTHSPEKYRELKQAKDMRERERQLRKNAWKRKQYQNQRQARNDERNERIAKVTPHVKHDKDFFSRFKRTF